MYGQATRYMHVRMYICSGALTRISQLECFFGLDEVVSVVFETSELALKDGKHASGIVRSKVTL